MQSFWKKIKKPIIALAPMAGYTDSVFRNICCSYGADVVYSEMISADALCHGNKKTLSMVSFKKKECPVVFQLFGNEPKKLGMAANIVSKIVTQKKISGVGIDINFGCPAHKIIKNNSGVVLMDKTELAHEIIRVVCLASFLPISLKIRTAAKKVKAMEFIKKIKKLPWQAVMIHGRSLNQGFQGEIDWVTIKNIVDFLPEKIVLANGGITDGQKAQEVLKKTGAYGVGVARGALGRPYIFEEIKKDLVKNENENGQIRLKKIILDHGLFFSRENNDDLRPLRKHLVHYVKNTTEASYLRQQMVRVKNFYDLQNVVAKMDQ